MLARREYNPGCVVWYNSIANNCNRDFYCITETLSRRDLAIFGYGEDALTLWALNKKLSVVLELLDDDSPAAKCCIFYRPSFGRSGGPNSAQFGEFDFIVLSTKAIYLGESKWDRSPEATQDGVLHLRDEQLLRHQLLRFYLDEWAFGEYSSWKEFVSKGKNGLEAIGITKPIAPAGSLLASNLQTIIEITSKQFVNKPAVKNVLLYFHNHKDESEIPKQVVGDFEVISIDYSENLHGNFVRL